MEKFKPFIPYLLAAGVGLILSLLSGLVGGVGPLTLLWKCLLSAVIWGGGSWGLHRLVKAFLPEVAAALEGEGDEESPGKEDEEGKPSAGKHLNLSTDDEGEASGDVSDRPPARPSLLKDPLAGLGGSLDSASAVRPPPVPMPRATPKPGDDFKQDEKTLAKAVRSVMNQ